MWFTFALTTILAALLVFIPGYLVVRSIGCGRTASIIAAPPISLFFFTTSGIIIYPLGYRGIIPFLITMMLEVILLCGISLLVRRLFKLGGAQVPEVLSLKTLGIVGALSCVIFFGLYVYAVKDPTYFLQFDDNYSHITWINNAIRTGVFSTFHVGAYEGLANPRQLPFAVTTFYYPFAFHDVVAAIVLITHVSVALAENAVNLVFCGVVYPIGIAAVVNCLFHKRSLSTLFVPIVILSNTAFPLRMLSVHGAFSNTTSFACIPALIFLSVLATGGKKDEKEQKSIRFLWQPCIALVLALFGSMFCHPNTLIFWAVIMLPYIVCSIVPRVFEQIDLGSTRRRIAIVGIDVGIILLAAVIWVCVLNAPFMEKITHFVWYLYYDLPDALRNTLTFGFVLGTPAWMLCICFWSGVIYTFKSKNSQWYVFSCLLVLLLFCGCMSENLEIKRLFAGFWYTDPERLAAMAAIVTSPIAIQGAVIIVKIVTDFILKKCFKKNVNAQLEGVSAQRSSHQNICVTGVVAAILVIILLSPWKIEALPHRTWTQLRLSVDSFGKFYNQQRESSYSARERAFVERVHQIVGDDLILNNPEDGSIMAYQIDGLNVYYKTKIYGEETEESYSIRTTLNSIATNSETKDAVKRTGAKYVIKLELQPDDQVPSIPHYKGALQGFELTDNTPGFEVVLAEGPYRLYRITAID